MEVSHILIAHVVQYFMHSFAFMQFITFQTSHKNNSLINIAQKGSKKAEIKPILNNPNL